MVHAPYRDNACVFDRKGMFINFVQLHLGNARVFIFGKNIEKKTLNRFQNSFFGINVGILFLNPVKSPDIVEAGNVIVMLVGKEYSGNILNVGPEHLLPEIGSGIDYQYLSVRFDQNRRT